MKNILLTILIFSLLSLNSAAQSFYNLTAKTIDGKEFKFSDLKGKRVMIVNVASKCGYTKQYKELQDLNAKYGNDKFVIIGFPANNFLSQEPGSDAEILEFCTSKYNVSFQMMSKISVKDENVDAVYKWLCQKQLNGVSDYEVKWNFQKFFIDENGKHAGKANPKIDPLHEDIIKWSKREISTIDL